MTRSRLALPFLTALLPGLSPSSSTHTTSFTTSTYSTPLVNATPLHTLTPFTPPTIPIDTHKSVESQVTYLWEHLYNPLFTSVTSMSTQLFQATFFTSPSIASTSTTTSVSERGGGGGGGGTEQYQELAQIDVNFNFLLLQRVLCNHTTSNTGSNTHTSSSSESSALYKASVNYPTCLLDIFTKIRSLSYTSIYDFLYDLVALRHDLVTILNTYTTTNTHTSTSASSTSVRTSAYTSSSQGISHTNNATHHSSNDSSNDNNTMNSDSVYADNILSAFDTVTAVGMNYLIVHKLELYQLHIAIYKEEEEAKGEGSMGMRRFNITTTTANTKAVTMRSINSTTTTANIDGNDHIISNSSASNIDTSSSSGSGGLFSIDSDMPPAHILPVPTTTTSTTTPAAVSPTTTASVVDDVKDTNTKHTTAGSGSSSNGTKNNTTVKAAKKKRKSPPIHDLNLNPIPATTTSSTYSTTEVDNSISATADSNNVKAKKNTNGSVGKNYDIYNTSTNDSDSVSNGNHVSSSMLIDEPTYTTTSNINITNYNHATSNNTSHSNSSSNTGSNNSNSIHTCITDPNYITSRFMHMWRVSCEHRFFNHILAQTMNGYGESSYSKLANPVPLYLSSYTSNYHSKMNAPHLFITSRSLIGWNVYITQGVKDDILYEQKDLLIYNGYKEYLSQQQSSELLAYNVPIESQISDQDVVNTMLRLSCSRSAEPTVNYWSSPAAYTTLPVHEYRMDISNSAMDSTSGNGGSGSGSGMLNETVTLLEDQYGAPTLPWNKAYHTTSTTPTPIQRSDKTVRHTSHTHEDPGGEMDGQVEEGESEEGHNYDPTPDYLRQDETLLMLDRYSNTYNI